MLQRGRSQSDPSSITEVRLGEARGAGKEKKKKGTLVGHLSAAGWWWWWGWGTGVTYVCHFRFSVIPLNLHATNVGYVVNVRHVAIVPRAVGPSR